MNELHQLGWDRVDQRALPSVPYKGRKKIYNSPTNSEVIRWLGPVFLNKTLDSARRRKRVPHWRSDATALEKRVHQELEQFFEIVVLMTGKKVRIEGWEGPKAAKALIEKAIRAYGRGKTSPAP